MNDIPITIIGVAVTDAREIPTKTGPVGSSFRLASNTRRFNKSTNTWIDGDTSYVNVNCWRSLAANVLECIHRGDPVVVTGRMRVREWSTSEKSGTSVEVDALTVGHDLARGVTTFAKLKKEMAGPDPWVPPMEDDDLEELARDARVSVAAMDADIASTVVTTVKSA